MWKDSQKWKDRCAAGEHGVVRFDVFCGHCGKQLGADVGASQVEACGVRTDDPMEIFCDSVCVSAYRNKTGKPVRFYGWITT
jgi:hypothetical protein